jgi:anti-sigma B factor antagonist
MSSVSEPPSIGKPFLLDERTMVVEASGELDLAVTPQLRDALDEAERHRPEVLRVEASRVGFIDSTALGVLLAAAHRAAEHGGRLQLVCGSPAIRRVLEMTMIDRTIDVLP